jgi:hypothetical protein
MHDIAEAGAVYWMESELIGGWQPELAGEIREIGTWLDRADEGLRTKRLD